MSLLHLLLLGLLGVCGAFRPARTGAISHSLEKLEKMRSIDRVTLTEENYDASNSDIWLDLFTPKGSSEVPEESLGEVMPILTPYNAKGLRRGSIDVNKLINSREFKTAQSAESSSSGATLENSNSVGSTVSLRRHSHFNSYLDTIKSSGQPTGIADTIKSSSGMVSRPTWTPDLGAWRVAVPEEGEEGAELRRPDLVHPPLLQDYLMSGSSSSSSSRSSASLSKFHESKVQELWQSVQKGTVRDMSGADSARVVEALRVAYTGLWGKTIVRSLDVSINRARGIAAVLGELKADADVVVAGVLHDVITEFKFDDNFAGIRAQLVRRFGEAPIALAEKYDRLPTLTLARSQEGGSMPPPMQSEDQMQMLVAFVEDYRCLYIRLADRVSTLRSLKRLPLSAAERKKIALECLTVYAPLAHKMGLVKVKGEMEDLAFKVVSPDAFQQSRYTQTSAYKAYHEVAERIQDLIRTDEYLLSQNGTFRLTYRIKDKYQLKLKMDRKGFRSLSDVKDALGLRVIINVPQWKHESAADYAMRGEKLCYYLTGRLGQLPGWAQEGALKDYISGRKENGYQSLHMYIRNQAVGTQVETQVRTMAMHRMAELGGAAHWYYKDTLYRPDIAKSSQYQKAWRSPQQLNATSPAALLGMAKAQLLQNRVFVVLEDKATVLNLKKGATALDGAFAIHSSLGLSTGSIFVNGKQSRYDRILRNGDIISVHRAEDQKQQPSDSSSFSSSSFASPAQLSWLSLVRTDGAKRALRIHFTKETRATEVVLGIVSLMMMLHLNSEAILKRNFGTLPEASQLVRFASLRFEGSDVGKVLMDLGRAGKPEIVSRIVGQLLDIPSADLAVISPAMALKWVRMQATHGFVDEKQRDGLLLPLLKSVLPALGYEQPRLEQRWASIVGPLSPERSPYFKSLSKALKSKRAATDKEEEGSLVTKKQQQHQDTSASNSNRRE